MPASFSFSRPVNRTSDTDSWGRSCVAISLNCDGHRGIITSGVSNRGAVIAVGTYSRSALTSTPLRSTLISPAASTSIPSPILTVPRSEAVAIKSLQLAAANQETIREDARSTATVAVLPDVETTMPSPPTTVVEPPPPPEPIICHALPSYRNSLLLVHQTTNDQAMDC